jgi:hypothetical protein
MRSLPNISTATSNKPIPSNDSQHSDKPQEEANLKIKSPQKNAQQMEDSKNMEASCVNTSQQVDASTVIAPEEPKASPKKTTEGSEAL